MLTGGQAVVADFGIARALQAADADALTQSGIVVGTPQYMSPEQAAGAVDARSDQYSLACTLYEMLIGQPPFTGLTSQAVMARHSLDPVPSLRVVRQTVPAAVESAIMRAMAKLPADRFPSMQRFLDALKSRALETAQPHSAAAAPSLPGFRSKGRWRVMAGLAALVLLGIFTWRFVAGWQSDRRGDGGRAITTVAVLPFHDLTVGPDSSYLGEAMTEELIDDLSEVGSLKVLSRNSGAVAQGTARSLAQLANELGIEAVVKGSIGKVADSIRVKVQVLRAPDSTLLLVKDYHGPLGKLPDLQREITTEITTSIRATLKGTERDRLARRREVNQRAYDAYLRGRFHLERDEAEPARLLFEQANRIAPDWAQPYVGMANYYTVAAFLQRRSPGRGPAEGAGGSGAGAPPGRDAG